MAGRGRHVLPETAVIFHAQQLEAAAGIQVTGQAGRALVARQDRVDRDPVAALEVLDVLAHFDHHAAEFMPEDGRVLDPVVKLSPENVQIGAANAGVAGRYQNIIWAYLRVGRVAQPDITVVVHYGSFHGKTSSAKGVKKNECNLWGNALTGRIFFG